MMVVLAVLVMAATLLPLALDHALPARRVRVGAEHLRAALLESEVRSMQSGQSVEMTLPDLRRAARLSSSTRITLTGLDGAAVDHLTLFPDGSSSGGHITLLDTENVSSLHLSAVTGHVRVDTHSFPEKSP
jgi:hypothetical protein